MRSSIKKTKAERLFRAIGEIDDNLLQEAMLYRPARKTAFSRVILLAATLSAFAVLVVAGTVIAMRGQNGTPNTPPVSEDHTPNAPSYSEQESANGESEAVALDVLLKGVLMHPGTDAPTGATYTAVQDASDLPFRTGRAHIVWEYNGTYYISRALTAREIATLTGELGKGERVGEQSPALSCKVWILLSDGTVVSPYLEPSTGNTANSSLFDYEAELIPSDAFLSYVSGILN